MVTTTAKVKIRNTDTRLDTFSESIFFSMHSGKMTTHTVAICQNTLHGNTTSRKGKWRPHRTSHAWAHAENVPATKRGGVDVRHNGLQHIPNHVHIRDASSHLLQHNAERAQSAHASADGHGYPGTTQVLTSTAPASRRIDPWPRIRCPRTFPCRCRPATGSTAGWKSWLGTRTAPARRQTGPTQARGLLQRRRHNVTR